MASEAADPIERWTATRRVALVVSLLKGETSVAEAARKYGLTVAEVEAWREKFLLGAENALRTRPKDEDAVMDEQIKGKGSDTVVSGYDGVAQATTSLQVS